MLSFTLIVLGAVVYILVVSYLVTNLDAELQRQGVRLQNFTNTWQAEGRPLDATFFDQLVRTNRGDEFTSTPFYVKLLRPEDGSLLRRSPDLGRTRIPLTRADFESALHGQQVLNTYQDNQGRQVLVLTLPIRDRAGHIIVVAQVSYSLVTVEQFRNILILFLGVGIIVAAGVAYGIGFLVTSHELRPLRTFGITMRNLSAQGLGTRISTQPTTLEMQTLTDAFNLMSERLEASFALQRGFVAAVSHELRTPLTSLRGQVDVLLLHPELGEDSRQDVQQIRTELERLSRLVNNLLTNARAEVGILPRLSMERTQPVELDALLIEVARQVRFLNRQVKLEFEQLQQANVPGDTDLLKQLVFNVVDNALTYCRPGDAVYLGVTCTHDVPGTVEAKKSDEQCAWARLSVRDTGPGIDPADLPRIFERHYRAQRTSTRIPSGSGLGLYIASLIAETHGGSITVESELGKGACFCIWLPRCAEIAV